MVQLSAYTWNSGTNLSRLIHILPDQAAQILLDEYWGSNLVVPEDISNEGSHHPEENARVAPHCSRLYGRLRFVSLWEDGEGSKEHRAVHSNDEETRYGAIEPVKKRRVLWAVY